MTYIPATVNHFRAIKSWAEVNDAKITLDVRTFEIEVKARNRYFSLVPQFLAIMDGQYGHVPSLTEDVTGLIGWLPYRPPLQWGLSSDKLLFKKFMRQHGQPTPDFWEVGVRPKSDHIFKSSRGSFGYQLYGPFSAEKSVPPPSNFASEGEVFAEAFIQGENLKLWYWGEQPFFAHLHEYPSIQGDGIKSVEVLTAEILQKVGVVLDDSYEMKTVRSSLAYQQVSMNDVPPKGKKIWIDYRYGRRYIHSPVTTKTDNALHHLPSSAVARATAAGRVLAEELSSIFPAPVLYSLDAVIDAKGELWWLEMNSNPMLPPDGYPLILATLFGTPKAKALA